MGQKMSMEINKMVENYVSMVETKRNNPETKYQNEIIDLTNEGSSQKVDFWVWKRDKERVVYKLEWCYITNWLTKEWYKIKWLYETKNQPDKRIHPLTK